ncbi:aa3-type cytochrome c oxidase subunit IV [Marinicauda algicola]|uniref:Aa3-type cytochrome c oxidase subunit IV n=1 Tax=Marinicauda algicola TaxID=2029849 RepID=A0A4S2H4A7_9PROT|nr:aa3-type cytochrome c oxidase subunit IV [Marinicauda algicola]TGY90363.1 aa3-type cytochrome c oxidase subunit IV [Marinicauda algicola]
MAHDYSRGEMDISEQKHTFESFISISVFSAAVIGLVVLFLSMTFGTGLGWLTSFIITAIVGGVIGVLLKQGTAYWLTVAILGVITVIAGFIIVGFFGS